jgi:hypothetical protein
MRVASLKLRPTMEVNIHNQCSNFKLVNPLLCALYMNKFPGVEVDAGSMTSVTLRPSRAIFDGSLTYQLQRKSVKYDGQLKSTYTILFIAWKSEGCKALRACVHMIECDKRIEWSGHKLYEYHQRYASQLSTYTGSIKDTWLIHDGTVLMTELELDFTRRDGRLNINISEGARDDHTKISTWINPKL